MRALTFGHWVFTPNPLPGLAALVLVVLFVRLGFWQLQRSDEVSAQQSAILAQAQLPALDINLAGAAAEPWGEQRWRPATVRGHWLAQPQLLLDNQPADGRVGYYVFTLLRLDGCDCAQLVNRGWIEADPDRTMLPELKFSPGTLTLRGTLAPLPPAGVGVRADVEALPGGLLRVQRLELAAIPLEPGVRLLPLILQLDPASGDGYQRKWQRPDLRAQRHVAYAVQWFIFALLAAGLYFGLNLKRRQGFSDGAPLTASPCAGSAGTAMSKR
jgi:surfeit locus 1 family protein